VFNGCESLNAIYYGGTAEDWASISIDNGANYKLARTSLYYYSETKPTTKGNYWRYVDGVPTAW
jgi:hypothetical protein